MNGGERAVQGTWPFSFPLIALLILLPCAGETVSAEENASALFWREPIGAAILGPPVAQASSVAAVCDDKSLRTFSKTGRELWRYYSAEALLPFLTRSREGTAYIIDNKEVLTAVNRSGRGLWSRELDSPAVAPVLLGKDGRVFHIGADTLECFTEAGYRLWGRKLSAPLLLPPEPGKDGAPVLSLTDGSLVISDAFGNLCEIHLPAIPAAIAPLATGEVAVAFANGRLSVFSPGKKERSLATLGGQPLALKASGGNLAFALTEGTVGYLDLETGNLLWKGQAAAKAPARISIDERGIYLLSPGSSAGFSLDGKRLWYINIRGSNVLPAFSDDGLLYSGGSDWILYAYRVEDRILATTGSLYAGEALPGYGEVSSHWADDPWSTDDRILNDHLAEIQTAVSSHSIGEKERDYLSYLEFLARTEKTTTGRDEKRMPLTGRIEALSLIGTIGSREQIPFLTALFLNDREPLIKSAAADAIGSIGVDPDGNALKAFARNLLQDPLSHEERLLVSIARATGSLCRFSGPPLSEQGIRLLTILSADTRPQVVRSAARSEILSFHIFN